ncbi:hypothetical protein EIMP300_18500 [Escherichia coli]|uniref:Uncharacterized protein n=1 Tax=Escherichia coli TaxID=562 RepID=A0A8S0FJS2_ECOLX|nr:hypothetical protein EIMP300_18500 [Escherichia coli]
MQMVTLFKQILINVLGSKQTAGAVRDIKDEIPRAAGDFDNSRTPYL